MGERSSPSSIRGRVAGQRISKVLVTQLAFNIRQATLADCPACQRLGRVPEIAIAPGWYLPLPYYRRVVRGKHVFLVAEIEKRIVGFVIFERIEAGFLGQYVVVDKTFRRRGLGSALLRAAEGEAKRRGAYFLLGYAVATSRGIQQTLKRLGYRRGQLTYEWMKGLVDNPRPGRFGAPNIKLKR